MQASSSLEASAMLYVSNKTMCVVCARVADVEGAVGPAEMHTLPPSDLGIKKGACRLAQNLPPVREAGRRSDEVV
jgi:hypothetical protein